VDHQAGRPEAIEPDQGLAARSSLARTMALLALAAAVLFVGLAVVVRNGAPGGDPRADVLGATIDRTPTTETPVVTEPPTVPPGYQVASVADAAFFTYGPDPAQDVAGSATVVERGETGVSLTVSGSGADGRAAIGATLENLGPRAAAFPEGLTVTVTVFRDGILWRTLKPSDEAVTLLGAGERVTVSTEVPLDSFGEYSLSASVAYLPR